MFAWVGVGMSVFSVSSGFLAQDCLRSICVCVTPSSISPGWGVIPPSREQRGAGYLKVVRRSETPAQNPRLAHFEAVFWCDCGQFLAFREAKDVASWGGNLQEDQISRL